MREMLQFYIGGRWVDPIDATPLDVINPANESACARVSAGSVADVDAAVAAAAGAFPGYAQSSVPERIELLEAVLEVFKRRHEDVAVAIMEEMGAPWRLATDDQAASGPQHIKAAIRALEAFSFDERLGTTLVRKEPVGPCALITPWNWPINQIAVKVAPALAAGCSMVLKPSEVAPLSAMVFAEILHDAGVPAGVFNLVNGDGPTVGRALSSHPDIAMVSFTGSTRAGVDVAQSAAPGVKRVAQELGGKSPNLILDDADLDRAVRRGAAACFENSGQSCNAPTRMLVPRSRLDDAAAIAAGVAEKTVPGDPQGADTVIGPVVSAEQWEKVQELIQAGIDEGAALITGGPGRPDGIRTGYYVKPTVFSAVDNGMRVAREEIFGPVLCLLPYDDEDEAVRIANDTPYGLSAYVSTGDLDRARTIAARLRAGMVHINGASLDADAPFGGYKHSGNGREWGKHGIDEFLEVKSVYGYETRS